MESNCIICLIEMLSRVNDGIPVHTSDQIFQKK